MRLHSAVRGPKHSQTPPALPGPTAASAATGRAENFRITVTRTIRLAHGGLRKSESFDTVTDTSGIFCSPILRTSRKKSTSLPRTTRQFLRGASKWRAWGSPPFPSRRHGRRQRSDSPEPAGAPGDGDLRRCERDKAQAELSGDLAAAPVEPLAAAVSSADVLSAPRPSRRTSPCCLPRRRRSREGCWWTAPIRSARA